MRTGKKQLRHPVGIIGYPLYLLLEKTLIITLSLILILHHLLAASTTILKKLLQQIKVPKITKKTLKPKQKKPFPIPKIAKPKINLTFLRPMVVLPLGATAITASVIYTFILKDLPAVDQLTKRNQIVSTKIYARDKTLLFKMYQNQNRSLVRLSDIPPEAKNATLAIEDADFYEHTGISIRGLLRAVKKNVIDKKTQGGSTITQQLVKNALLNNEKTLARKIKEAILAIQVELHYNKNQILEMYFNEVGYGGPAYGIEEGSYYYFGKSARDVNLAEAALLAGLPAAPTTYSPFGANPQLAFIRQHQVLNRMVEEGFITPEEAEAAKSTKLSFAPQRIDIKAPHFIMYIKDLLVQQYGEKVVNQGGLEVITSLDPHIQNLAEQAIDQELDQLQRLHITNAAALVTNPQTGEILAMVGSKNYFDFENDGQVNVTLRPRQPGSSIKPINYAVALENGFTPATVIDDSPIVYRIPGSPPYAPTNYDQSFHGKIPLRRALANSYNVPAVKTLSYFGVDKMIEKGKIMGITTWDDPSRFGLSLTLGGGEVKMVDMAVVYGSLANQGERVDLNPILEVSDYTDKVYQTTDCNIIKLAVSLKVHAAQKVVGCQGTPTVIPAVAYQLTDILSDNNARATAFGRHSVLNIPGHQVAVKTGTTNNLRDNWTIGYTTNYVVAVWVGNNDNSPMSYVASGITGASPIWQKIMGTLLQNTPPHQFAPPPTLVKATVCGTTGTLTCASCPNPYTEYFIPGTEPKTTCASISTTPKSTPHPTN